jgi:hypothetical protein
MQDQFRTSYALLGRENGYVFFPIPNHLRSFSMRFAIGRVYAVVPIETPDP